MLSMPDIQPGKLAHSGWTLQVDVVVTQEEIRRIRLEYARQTGRIESGYGRLSLEGHPVCFRVVWGRLPGTSASSITLFGRAVGSWVAVEPNGTGLPSRSCPTGLGAPAPITPQGSGPLTSNKLPQLTLIMVSAPSRGSGSRRSARKYGRSPQGV